MKKERKKHNMKWAVQVSNWLQCETLLRWIDKYFIDPEGNCGNYESSGGLATSMFDWFRAIALG